MPVLRKILPILLVAVILYAGLLVVERMSTQELTRASDPATQQAVALIWKPQFLKGRGLCTIDLIDSAGKVTDTASLPPLDSAFNALQQYGQLSFQGENITVSNQQSGEVVHRFVIKDGRLSK
jgi:hypothetical protein